MTRVPAYLGEDLALHLGDTLVHQLHCYKPNDQAYTLGAKLQISPQCGHSYAVIK